MTAGSGIVHSERTPPELRNSGSSLFGVQTWVALPHGYDEAAPAFAHHAAATPPLVGPIATRNTVCRRTAIRTDRFKTYL
jgi:redox-sensitive bicupin YhaK (pirin superfamily)